MKKISLVFPALATLGLILGGCKKDFLEGEDTSYLNTQSLEGLKQDEQVKSKIIDGTLKGAYDVLYDIPPQGSHDNAGIKSINLAWDLSGQDALMVDENWFVYDYMRRVRGAIYRRPRMTWKLLYTLVANVNLILKNDFSTDEDTAAYKARKSEPLALRGIAYWYLANAFQQTYKGYESALAVPIVLEPVEAKIARNTVEEVYQQVLEDLTYAATNGSTSTSNKENINRYTAAAYLAKVYAQMENWTEVERWATVAKQGGTDVVSTPGRSWELVSSPDVLWGKEVNTLNTMGWASIQSHLDPTIVSYAQDKSAQKYIDKRLYESIPVTDSRRKLFFHETLNADVSTTFKSRMASYADYTQLKFAPGTPSFAMDCSYIRVQDPILLEIEAKNELGKTEEAKTLLNAFVQKRNPNFTAPSTQADLREEIRFQRRIELWLEGSHLLDMKRWKLPIIRSYEGTNHQLAPADLAVGAKEWYYQIPQVEIDANNLLVQQD